MKRIEKKFDILFWFLVDILPIVLYFVLNFRSASPVDFSQFISNFRFDFVADIFNQIFTNDLVFPVVLVDFLSYFVSVGIIHIFVDFVLFIPRFAHNVFEKFTFGD